MELHRLIRADDTTSAVRPPPYPIVIIHQHQTLDLLAQLHIQWPGVTGRRGTFGNALVQLPAETVYRLVAALDIDKSAGDARFLVEHHNVGARQIRSPTERFV